MIRRFDVVAVQEVRGNLRALRYLLKVLGEDWGFILTDVTLGRDGNNERLAFLFDTRRVKPSGLACELVVPLEQGRRGERGRPEPAVRPHPLRVSFLSGGQTFTLVTLHVDYGDTAADRVPELAAIAQWLAGWAEREFGWDHNLIALGDFNIDREGDPLFDAFTSTGLTSAPQLEGLPRTIFDKPGAAHFYDQIAWFTKGQQHRPVLRLEVVAGGLVDFVDALQGESTRNELSWHISDHYPLWGSSRSRRADGLAAPDEPLKPAPGVGRCRSPIRSDGGDRVSDVGVCVRAQQLSACQARCRVRRAPGAWPRPGLCRRFSPARRESTRQGCYGRRAWRRA
ncbi:endonuclease/exonuclease/phosphatase family protein [Streptomyces sp. R35]|uniref:Endonuclease/exonuclease/phosphatase family protein n=1 Tax=Streptomyces sp. R35 TaxID=3238630 RepID=A0AB39SQ78_9ACTN